MPYSTFQDRKQIESSIELPQNLGHKPIFAMPYEKFERTEESDVKYISVGFAQWENDNYDLSLKLMRHTGDQWSPQAEELPPNRLIDAAIFLSKVIFDEKSERVEIEREVFTNQHGALSIQKEELSADLNRKFRESKNVLLPTLKKRINSLYLILDRYKKMGLF